MEKSPAFFIYVRKSTDEGNRQVLSIEAQLFELREMAKKEGLNVIRVFEERPRRPPSNRISTAAFSNAASAAAS